MFSLIHSPLDFSISWQTLITPIFHSPEESLAGAGRWSDRKPSGRGVLEQPAHCFGPMPSFDTITVFADPTRAQEPNHQPRGAGLLLLLPPFSCSPFSSSMQGSTVGMAPCPAEIKVVADFCYSHTHTHHRPCSITANDSGLATLWSALNSSTHLFPLTPYYYFTDFFFF